MIYSNLSQATAATGADKLVPFTGGVFGFLYTNCREYIDCMSNEERYEANIRSDFRTRQPRLAKIHDGVAVVRL